MNAIDADTKRELRQLWYVAQCYMSLAGSLKDECFAFDSRITVQELASKCNSLADIKNGDVCPFIMLNAHMSSAAARLVAIDENQCFKGRHDSRLKVYDESIHPCVNSKKKSIDKDAKQLIIDTKNKTMHFVLRNLVCHAEYKNNLEIIGDIKCLEVYEAMTVVLDSVKNDLVRVLNENMDSPHCC